MNYHLLPILLLMIFHLSSVTTDAEFHNATGFRMNYCKKLKNVLQQKKKRYLYYFGKPHNLTIMWGVRSPNRVAGALLLTALKYQYGYQSPIKLIPGPRTLQDLSGRAPYETGSDFSELVIHMGAESSSMDTSVDISFVTDSRLSTFRQPVAPLTLRLHAHVTEKDRNNPLCLEATHWTWFRNKSAVTECGFDGNVSIMHFVPWLESGKAECRSTEEQCVIVLVACESDSIHIPYEIIQLLNNIIQSHLSWQLVTVPERILRNYIEMGNSTFLFMDYDIWEENNKTFHVQPPLSDFQVDVVRAADITLLKQAAPPIYNALYHQYISPKDIHDILKLEATGIPIEEAACAHTVYNIESFKTWATDTDPIFYIFVLGNCLSNLEEFTIKVQKYLTKTFDINVKIVKPIVKNCSDMTAVFNLLSQNSVFSKTIGVLGAGDGAVEIAKHALDTETLLVLYDVPPEQIKLSDAVRTSVGTSKSLFEAIKHFISSNKWKRIAIISERSHIASDFEKYISKEFITSNSSNRWLDSLSSVLVEDSIKISMIEDTIEGVLNELRQNNGRIFFVNTGTVAAKLVMCKALKLGMTPAAGFAWIVRDWDENAVNCTLTAEMEHFTLTYSWQGLDNFFQETNNETQEKFNDMSILRSDLRSITYDNMPSSIAPLADAIIVLVHTVSLGLKFYPQLQYGLHGDGATRLFSKASINSTAMGISQELKQSKFALDTPLVFVNKWSGGKRKALAVWRVNGNLVEELKNIEKPYTKGSPPHDGTKLCLHSSGDPFYPTCQDGFWAILVVFLIFTPIVVWTARKVRNDAMAAHYRALNLKLLARCDHVAGALADYVIDRSALDLKTEVGAGYFGRVRLGTLTLPNKAPMVVAVKALRENANRAGEAEFLREACALAMLSHENIIGFVGVCADTGPPLLLMKHAFFGDLLRYLYERRPLVPLSESEGDGICCTEAKAVSAIELTRLAREAADALAYLAEKRFVHRDIRAANCLVDEKRTLKLADFGLARAIRSESDSSDSLAAEDKYISHRHGMFPVPWMAPETLLNGIFSSASDVWALGVLMLEIVTLGERPYRNRNNLDILKYVSDGGHPPLPRDITYHTSVLLLWCWTILPASRPSAATIARRLREQPRALRPALRPASQDPCRSNPSWLNSPGDLQLRISTL